LAGTRLKSTVRLKKFEARRGAEKWRI